MLTLQRPGQNSVTVGGINVTGLNRWWGFTEGGISGVGRYFVNVASGNLVVQAGDMAVPHRGTSFSFERSYNSYSQHDWNNTDQGGVNNYGDGWTNTFDMHIAKNSLSGGAGISVFDENGSRYDYEKDCTPSCGYKINSPLGQYSVLTYDNTTGWYYWTNKSGTVFLFHNLSDNAGVAGRLAKVWSRNNNVRLIFTYSFDAGPSPAPSTLSSISIQTDSTNGSAQTTQLSFSNVSTTSGTRRLLTSLLWPDGATSIAYKYDTSGRLIEVDEPTNNTTNASIPQIYQYASTGYLLTQVSGGRWSLNSATPAPSPAPLGGYVQFAYNGSSVTDVQSFGYINPTVLDDSGTGPVQSTVSGTFGKTVAYRQTYFAYSNVSPAPSPAPPQSPTGSAACTSTGNTPVYDTDGHDTVFCWDSAARVVQSSQWTGGTWLTAQQVWDGSNNLVSSIDTRLNRTDMAYDANGNLIAQALPSESGSPRPTTLYTYDASNNMVAACDPAWSDANGFDWTATPSPTYSPCPSTHANTVLSPGPTLQGFATSSPDPFGELVSVTKPFGYTVTTSYSAGPQAGTSDYGQPTEIKGATITQADGSNITPTTDFYYDNYGNTICSVTRGGLDASPTSNTAINIYTGTDALMGRVSKTADADDASTSNANHNGSCPKTAGIPGSTIVSTFTYFPNGQVATGQSPVEAAAGVTTQYGYDADGDQTSETTHFGSGASPAPTTRSYDADDRLVEVVQPGGWDVRYDYDLTENESTNTTSTTLVGVVGAIIAHGGLFKAQEYHATSGGWIDMRGAASDNAGRIVAKYSYAPNSSCNSTNLSSCEPASATTNVYDTSAGPGMLSTSTDAVGIQTTFTYDNVGKLASTSYNDAGTHGTAFTYDLNGRTTAVASTCATGCSTHVETYAYDRDGNQVEKVEQPEDNSDPTVLTYAYYPDGSREYISAAPSPSPTGSPGYMSQSNLFTYEYDAAGRTAKVVLAYATATPMSFTFAQSRAGRPTGATDPYRSTALSYDAAGRLLQIVAPQGTTSFGSYDAEGEVLSFTEPSSATAVSQDFDSVGEMVSQTPPGSDPNGCQLGFTQIGTDGYMLAKMWTWSSFGGVCQDRQMTGNEDLRNTVQAETWIPTDGGKFEIQEPYTFDADGRMTVGWRSGGPICCSFSRKYNSQSLLTEQDDSAGNVQMKRTYAPDGHIAQIGTADSSHVVHWETLHWDGDQWYTMWASGMVGKVNPSGVATQYSLATPQNPGHPPEGITVGPGGNLWIAESNPMIDEVSTDGTIISELSLPGSGSGITYGPDGNLWVTGYDSDDIYKVTPTGSVTTYPIGNPCVGGLTAPLNIARGSDGAMWFTESLGNGIGRIDMAGHISTICLPPNGATFDVTGGPDGNVWFTVPGMNDIGEVILRH